MINAAGISENDMFDLIESYLPDQELRPIIKFLFERIISNEGPLPFETLCRYYHLISASEDVSPVISSTFWEMIRKNAISNYILLCSEIDD